MHGIDVDGLVVGASPRNSGSQLMSFACFAACFKQFASPFRGPRHGDDSGARAKSRNALLGKTKVNIGFHSSTVRIEHLRWAHLAARNVPCRANRLENCR